MIHTIAIHTLKPQLFNTRSHTASLQVLALKFCMHVTSFLCALFHPSWFYHPNNTRMRAQIIKLQSKIMRSKRILSVIPYTSYVEANVHINYKFLFEFQQLFGGSPILSSVCLVWYMSPYITACNYYCLIFLESFWTDKYSLRHLFTKLAHLLNVMFTSVQ
jgi:hypothetical protein